MEDEVTTLQLSKSEAIVLFEFLWRFSQDKVLNIEDQSEQRVLWNLCCDLESKLVEPFAEDYSEILANARSEIRDKEG